MTQPPQIDADDMERRKTRCEHGAYWPHPCDECDDEAVKPHNLIAQITTLRAEKQVLVDALKFYAERRKYVVSGLSKYYPLVNDEGKIARQALAGKYT